jgi:hypothetical protein
MSFNGTATGDAGRGSDAQPTSNEEPISAAAAAQDWEKRIFYLQWGQV